MPGLFVELMKRMPSFESALHVYVRFLAIYMLLAGLSYWSVIIGIRTVDGVAFVDLSMQMHATIVFFAVLDLVAAIGLWLLSSWGTVLWLFRSLAQVVMYSLFSSIFGRSPFEVVFYISAIALYLILLYLTEREDEV